MIGIKLSAFSINLKWTNQPQNLRFEEKLSKMSYVKRKKSKDLIITFIYIKHTALQNHSLTEMKKGSTIYSMPLTVISTLYSSF